MRRVIALSSLATLAITGALAVSAGSAAASGSAPAPNCTSWSSQIACNASAPVSPVTWTESLTSYGTTYTSTFSAAYIRGGCSLHTVYTLSYTYVYNGATYASPVTRIACNPNPPE
jgi:hypothetical protein